MSSSLVLWVTPPPDTTAFLSKYLSPGAVFRVDATFMDLLTFPTNSTILRVSVAIPLILIIRFNAVLSALSIASALPEIFITIRPSSTRDPSVTKV